MNAYTFLPRSGSTLLLIHGLGSDRRCFDGALSSPDIREWSLLVPDLPGFGEARVPENYSFSLEDAAAYIGDLLRALKIRECALVGHSMGGAIGILVAERFKITHFVNALGNLSPEDATFSRRILGQSYADFSATGFQAYKDDVYKGRRADRPASIYLEALEKTNAKAMYLSARDLVHQSDAGNLLERFVNLNSKKMYLHDSDSPVPAGVRHRLDRAGIVRRLVPDSGHGLMEDNPMDFYRLTGRFLGKG